MKAIINDSHIFFEGDSLLFVWRFCPLCRAIKA